MKVSLKILDIEVMVEDPNAKDRLVMMNEAYGAVEALLRDRINIDRSYNAEDAEDMQGDKPTDTHTTEPKINNIPHDINMEIYR